MRPAKRAAISVGVSERSRSAWSTARNKRAGRGVSKLASRARVAAARASASLKGAAAASGSPPSCLASSPAAPNDPSASSGPSASGFSSAAASAANGLASAEISARRHRSTSGKTPGMTMRGARPARSSDDLPEPEAPIISRNDARVASAADDSSSRRRLIAWSTNSARPKNTLWRLSSNAVRPGKGEPSLARFHTVPLATNPRRASHCRRQSSTLAANASVVSNSWKAARNSPERLRNQVSKKPVSRRHCASISARSAASSATSGACGRRKT